MPLFISDEELRLLAGDAAAVAERADAAIRELRRQVDTVRAEADAAAISAEQTCALLEQRFAALSAEFDRSQAEVAEMAASSERRAAELAASQAEIHQLHLQAIAKDGDIERLKAEVSELQKSKRQSLEVIEQRDVEIREKDSTIQSFLEKTVNLADAAAGKEARIHEVEVKLTHCQATCNRITQEKELLEKHNLWLDEELKAKIKSLAELRKANMDEEAKMSVKITELERQISESSSSLRRSKERISELEQRISYLEKELCSTKDAAASNEQHLHAELSTVMKLAELHKESSEEWSKKAGELEGVIKALETHLTQVDDQYKEKLEKETSARKELEKEATDLRQKLEKCESELENARKSSQLSLIPLASFPEDPAYLADTPMKESSLSDTDGYRVDQNDQMIVPKVPAGVSGTALAASLLRDGWSLAKMYEKYQEATDALRHERWGRRHAEAVLERVLHEIEEKAELILDERAEHDRMVEAYALMDQKLQQALMEHDKFENTIRKLKSELRKRERDHSIAQKEIDDLQKQVAVLLKECQDIQLRCGSSPSNLGHGSLSASLHNVVSNVETDIHEHMSFKDINGLVQQNVQLRNQVDMLTSDLEKRDMELRESFQIELQKVTDDAAARVEKVMKKSEEQGIMIESLHRSVAMYRKLCEEQQKNRSNGEAIANTLQDDGKKDLMLLYEGSQEISKKGYEQVAERARNLEEELTKLRSELVSLRSGRDKAVLEADFARDRLNGFMVELEHQRKEANSISARNVELMHLLVDYQKRLRESVDSMQAFEENSRKLSMEVSILKNEKEILVKSEKRALDEVHNLTERVHRLQATLDTIHTTEEVQENARAVEKRNQEEHIKRLERDWAELKKELQEQRDHVRVLELDKKNAFDGCMKQVEDMRKELSISWKAVSDAESRAAVAEAKCSDLEARLKGRKIILKNNGRDSSTSSTEANEELFQLREELQKYKEEAEANKNYMLQYKEIAHSNEVALKQMESAHQDYKTESDLAKKTLEEDILNLRSKLSEVEKNYVMKCEEASTIIEAKEKDISSLMNEISVLRKEVSEKVAQIETLEIQLASSKSALEEQYIRWRSAQDNYERQVILQSETIQELTSTSKQLSSLQQEIAELRQTAEAQKAENDALRTFVEQEKIELLKAKDEAQRKYNELNEQNKILHNQLEVLHIRLAEKERSIAGFSSQHADSQREDDLHSVISYLRRSKEIAETEISLLKQEKSRLQIELESALKSAKEAQDLIRNQAESSRTLMFKDEEFKSLQLQVREINLLRESNIQLRGENKHNFEECQKLRDEVQNVKKEAERLHNLLLEKQVEAEMHQKELEMQKNEIANLNQRIVELVENSKGIDLNEYETMKAELQNTKSILRENGVELEQAKSLLLERELVIRNLEEKLARCQSELDAWESKLNDVETSMKSEIDKQKKVYFSLKRKHEILMKEKEDVVKDNHGLLKQTEDLKSIQKATSEIALEQAVKEKDFRIQTLEKTLEKERDDNKKEKVYRKKAEKVFTAAIQNVSKEKKQVEEAIEMHRQAVKEVFERSGIAPSQIPSGSALDEQAVSYFFTAKQMEDSSSPFHDGATSQFPPVETPTTDASAAAAGRQVATPARPAQAKAVEERAATALSKPNPEVRRPGGRRPLVRPTLERTEEPQVDADISIAEGSMAVQEEKGSSSLERENSGGVSSLQSSTRKRLISFLQTREDASQAEHGNDATPALKKPKEEHLQGTSELKSVQSPTEDVVMAQVPVLPSTESTDAQQPIEEMDTDQAMVPSEEVDATKEEDVGYKDETEEQTDALLETRSHETEALSDNDATTLEEIPDKSGAVVESIDDEQKIEDVKKETPVDGEDEREEGELMPEEPEQQQDGTTMGETHQEPTPTDVGEQTGDSLRAASPGGLTEKSDADTSEETGEGDTTTDGAAVEPDQSPQVPFGGPEGSPSTQPEAASPTRDASSSLVPASTSSEQQNLSTVTEAVETRTRRTINLSERAQQNRVARLAQASQQASRGRGRPSLRKDGTRGLRGRGGRGQT